MLTAETITDAQIKELILAHPVLVLRALGHEPDHGRSAETMRKRKRAARTRCAEILNARAKPSYPHTLTSDQFAIVSVALDAYRERCSDAAAVDELRKLWAFSGPITLNARAKEAK